MSTQFVFANNVQTTLANAASTSQTTITLASTANFPTIPAGYFWAVTLNDAATQAIFEVVYVTSISGSNLTVLRAQEGTAAHAWNVGDFAFACATAGVLASFLNASSTGSFVELSPASQQAGSIDISGAITAGGMGTFDGIVANGPITNATSGSFSGDVSASDLIATRTYGNTALGSMPLRVQGAGGTIGIGPSSGLSVYGITASALAIGLAGSPSYAAFDTDGDLGLTGNLYAYDGIFGNEVNAQSLLQNGYPVVVGISSSSLTLSRTGGNVDIEMPVNTILVGGSIVAYGNGGAPSITLPNYGIWFIEVIYAIEQTSNSNMTIGLSLSGGAITGGFISNANNTTAFNSVAWITLYGAGETNTNNQVLTFALSVSGGTLYGSQPWTVRATRRPEI